MPPRLHATRADRLADRMFACALDHCAPESGAARGARIALLRHAHGTVVEVGAGTGASLDAYPRVERLILVEPSEAMRRRLAPRARARGAEVVDAVAEQLPVADASADTVVCSLVLCSVPEQDAALREIRRVLRPDGRLLLYEHVRSPDPRLAAWQERLRGPWATLARGCHPDRDTLAAVERAGFRIVERHSVPLGGAIDRLAPHVAAVAVPTP